MKKTAKWLTLAAAAFLIVTFFTPFLYWEHASVATGGMIFGFEILFGMAFSSVSGGAAVMVACTWISFVIAAASLVAAILPVVSAKFEKLLPIAAWLAFAAGLVNFVSATVVYFAFDNVHAWAFTYIGFAPVEGLAVAAISMLAAEKRAAASHVAPVQTYTAHVETPVVSVGPVAPMNTVYAAPVEPYHTPVETPVAAPVDSEANPVFSAPIPAFEEDISAEKEPTPIVSAPANVHTVEEPAPAVAAPVSVHTVEEPVPAVTVPESVHTVEEPTPAVAAPASVHTVEEPAPAVAAPASVHTAAKPESAAPVPSAVVTSPTVQKAEGPIPTPAPAPAPVSAPSSATAPSLASVTAPAPAPSAPAVIPEIPRVTADKCVYNDDGTVLISARTEEPVLYISGKCHEIGANAFTASKASIIVIPPSVRIIRKADTLPSGLKAIFYMGTREDWAKIGMEKEFKRAILKKDVYFYGESPVQHACTWTFAADGVTPQVRTISLF